MIRITHDTFRFCKAFRWFFAQKKNLKTEWKSFEFYSESSSECNQCELQAVLRPV